MTLGKVVKAVLVVVAVLVVALLYPPVRLSGLVLAGRSPACPLGQAIKAEDNGRRQLEGKDRILAASKVVAKDDHYEQWQTPYGLFWVPAESRYGLPFHLAEQERDIYGSGQIGVQTGDIVLDCGANVGTFTRKALTMGAKTVVAIEPAPENIEVLRRTFASEIKDGRVIVYTKGVWDKDDWLTLHVDHTNSAADSFVMHPKDATPLGQKLPLTTMDKLVAELKLPTVNFIKMDIEGAETRALIGGRGTISQHHPRLAMSVYHQPDHAEQVPKIIRETWSGYRVECGPCTIAENRIKPQVMYFY